MKTFRILVANDRTRKPDECTRIEEFQASGPSRLTLVEAEYNLRWAGILERGFEVVLVQQVAE